MSIVHIEHRSRWTGIANTMLEDRRLSFKARGLLAYLLTKPEGWQTQVAQLTHASDHDGRSAIYSALEELTQYGYATYEQPREAGRFIKGGWTIRETPQTGFPLTENPDTEKSPTENRDLSKDLGKVKTEDSKTEEETLPLAPSRGKAPRKKAPPSPQALDVLSHLCRTTGRDFRVTTQIDTLLNTGVTPQECLTVIDWLHVVKRQEDPEWCERWFDNVTPFRPANFDKYRVRAVHWKSQNTSPQSGHIDSISGERILPRKMVL